MNIDKISISNSFRGKNVVKKGVTTAVATAASALFAASKKEGVDSSAVIDEYYKNEFALRNKKYDFKGLARFSPVEKLEILNNADAINLYPKAFYRISRAKNDDDSPRFSADQTLILFHEAGSKIEKYPELFKNILDTKDENQEPRFNVSDCAMLMNEAELLIANPKAFNKLLNLGFGAAECKELMLRRAEQIEQNPEILDEAVSGATYNSKSGKYINSIVKSLDSIIERNCKALAAEEARIQAEKDARRKQIEDEIKAAREEKMRQIKEAAKKRAEEKAARAAEEMRIKQETMQAWDKQVGWISAERIFEKVNAAVANQTPLVLENGEVLPDVMVEKVAKHIKEHPTKAKILINERYNNLQPMFDEKDCFDILSEMDSYFYATDISNLKAVNENGKPFFTPQQCKELLQVRCYDRNKSIGKFMYRTSRKYNVEEIVELVKNADVTDSYRHPFDKFANEKNEQGEYKYTVSEAIELARKNEIKSIFDQ